MSGESVNPLRPAESGADGSAPSLCPASVRAVDALVDSGFDADAVEQGIRARCGVAARLLSYLGQSRVDCGCPDKAVLASLARIAASARTDYGLGGADEETLELLVANGWDPRRVPSAVRERASRQALLLGVLDSHVPSPAGDADRLVAATLARVHRHGEARAQRLRIHEPSAPARRGIKWADFGAIAALLVVAASVAWPAMAGVRQRAQQTACFGNLDVIGQALASYASDSADALPMATASLAGSTWWNVGKPEQSNSANLFTLARHKYANAQQLACCGNACAKECTLTDSCTDWHRIEQVSYSFQNLFAKNRPSLHDERFVVLSDRNPAVLRAVRGERVIFVNENSPNHGGRGQNVLFSDGAASWVTSPVLPGGENIWLPRSVEQFVASAVGKTSAGHRAEASPLKGCEEPEKADTFLVP